MHSKTREIRSALHILVGLSALLLAAPAARPQDRPTAASKSQQEYKVVYLKYISSKTDANDCQTTVRNMLPGLHIYYDPSSNSISLGGPLEEVTQAQQIIAALDIPQPGYRITYTLTEMDNGQRVGVQHYSVVVQSGDESSMKEGSRVPIFTAGKAGSDIQYLDVGLLVDARLQGGREGLSLRTKMTQSSIGDDKQSPAMTDPVIRQTEFDGVTTVEAGTPLRLGSLDVPGSTRHLDIEVLVEPIH